jgi:hypothetical protein
MEFKVKHIGYLAAAGLGLVAYRRYKKRLSDFDYMLAGLRLGVDPAAIKAIAYIESNGIGFYENGNVKLRLEPQFLSRYQKTPRYFTTFSAAYAYDPRAAILSTSFGIFQVMGFNYKAAGYSSPESYYNAVKRSAIAQLNAFVGFIEANNLAQYLRSKNWAAFAYRYNGPGYKANNYDTKLETYYNKFK